MRVALPKNNEARRCVLIVIEEHIGVIVKVMDTYALVRPYQMAECNCCCHHVHCECMREEGCKHCD